MDEGRLREHSGRGVCDGRVTTLRNYKSQWLSEWSSFWLISPQKDPASDLWDFSSAVGQGTVVRLNHGQVLRIVLLALQVSLPADASGWWLPSAAGLQHQALSVLCEREGYRPHRRGTREASSPSPNIFSFADLTRGQASSLSLRLQPLSAQSPVSSLQVPILAAEVLSNLALIPFPTSPSPTSVNFSQPQLYPSISTVVLLRSLTLSTGFKCPLFLPAFLPL